MGLGKFKREAPGDGENPVVIAAYWKNVLDNHIDAVLDRSVSSFKSKSNDAVSTVRTCASHLDEVAKDCGIATTVGGSAGVVGGALVIGGIIAAPFTGGLSLGLTLGGAGLGVAGGVTNITASLVNHGWEKSDTERAKDATTAVVNIIEVFEELLTICVHAFTQAREYLKTEEGRKFAALLEEAARNNGYIDPKSSKAIALDAANLAKGLLNGGIVAYRTIGVIEFIMTGTYAKAGVQSALAIQKAAGGVAIGGRTIIMVGSTGAKVLSAGFGVLGIGLGIWDIVSGAMAIHNGSETGQQMRKFADDMDTTTKELLDIYNNLS